jgi:hypothetical protein
MRGSFKGILLHTNACCRFGQYVLSKVDPSESFLKALPQQADSLDILYPVSSDFEIGHCGQ